VILQKIGWPEALLTAALILMQVLGKLRPETADDSDDHTMYAAAAAVFPADRLGVAHQGANAKVSALVSMSRCAMCSLHRLRLRSIMHVVAARASLHASALGPPAALDEHAVGGLRKQELLDHEVMRMLRCETRGYHFHPACLRKGRPLHG
jgi:hypothetical protein